jgi:hypothetical protein
MLDNMMNFRPGGVGVRSGRGRMRHALAKQILRFQVVQLAKVAWIPEQSSVRLNVDAPA